MENLTCSASSRAAGEQLFASAARADHWFLLEEPHPHGDQAFEEARLPAAVKDHLSRGAAACPNSRIQLIKKGAQFAGEGIKFFVAVNHEEQPNLYEFTLSRYEDLLDLDLAAMAAEDARYRQHDRTEPLFLVCTNGRRDPCCASLGLPLYRELRNMDRENVWQTSHVTGHRFAPNVVALPHGVYYGYVTPGGAQSLVDAHRRGRMFLPAYRGRSCYEKDPQAAEALLRNRFGLQELYRFQLIEIETISEVEAVYHFADLLEGKRYCAQVAREPKKIQALKSCRDEQPGWTDQYRLVDVAVHEQVGRV
jgi:hypothetical protein